MSNQVNKVAIIYAGDRAYAKGWSADPTEWIDIRQGQRAEMRTDATVIDLIQRRDAGVITAQDFERAVIDRVREAGWRTSEDYYPDLRIAWINEGERYRVIYRRVTSGGGYEFVQTVDDIDWAVA
jgi:hypothetical protein